MCADKWQAIKAIPCGRWIPARVLFVSSPFHCLHELDRQISQADGCATIGNCKTSRLLFADGLVLLSTESGFQRALNSFADAYNTAGMKISTAKTELLHLSRNPVQCLLQLTNKWSDNEAGREVQVSWGCIYD